MAATGSITLWSISYIDKLLNVGGHVVFDDPWMPSVRKVASFALKNTGYQLVHPTTQRRTPPWKRVLRTGRRIMQNPFGRDWALKCVPQNMALLKKLAVERAGRQHHRAF